MIVVGNLTVGGTGKTPLVIWLAEFLRQSGYKPGIVSRGYGGKRLEAPLSVTAASDPAEAGDEPVLIARRTGCPVMVFPERAEAGRQLLAANDCDVILCDDGLQHYALARDIEIAVMDGWRRIGNGALLPAGPLREPVERLQQVDILVCQGGQPQAGEYAMTLEDPWAVSLLDSSSRKLLADLVDTPIHAVAGIGHPGRFFDDLRKKGLRLTEHAFPDHHLYRKEEICFSDDWPVMMTEKDAVKCKRLADSRHWYVPVSAVVPPELGENLLALLKGKGNG